MKKLSLFLVVLAIISLSNFSFSQLIFTEDFTGYNAGALAGQGGWTHGGSGADAPVVANATPLIYTGYNSLGGNYLNFATNSATSGRLYKDFADTTTDIFTNGTPTTVYYSLLLNLSATSLSSTGYFFSLGQSNAVAQYVAKLFAKQVTATTYNIGLSNVSTTTEIFSPTPLNVNQTYLIIVRYNIFNTPTLRKLNTCELWVNPSLSSEPDTNSADIKYPAIDSTFTAYNIGAVCWHNRNATNPLGSIDAIRVSRSFTSSAEAWSFLAPGTVPVELTSFSASVVKGAVNLSWKTATEVNNMGFNVERSSNKSDWTKLAFVQGNQTTTSTNSYSYVDKSVNQTGNYYYRLKQIDNDGSYKYSSIVEVDVNSPSVFTLNQNYPNPFNPSTVISYTLPQASNVKLMVYNAIGQPVRVLENGFKNSGTYNVTFNASELSSGIYFCKIEAGQFSSIRKMMLVK
jgi:hypothetical protein